MNSTNLKTPPAPPGKWLLGNLREYQADPLSFLRDIAEQYGDVVRFRLGRRRVYLLSHPDYVHEVLVKHHSNFMKGGIAKRAAGILGNGLITSDGEFHVRQRRLVQPAFSRERLQSYAEVMIEYAEQTRNRWQHGATVDIREEMLRLTLGIVGRTLFGTDVEKGSREVGEALTVAFEYFSQVVSPVATLLYKLPFSKGRRFRQAKKCLDDTIYKLLAERRSKEHLDQGDVLSILLNARDHEGDRTGMTEVQVRDEAMTLFLAGHETVAIALSWTWFLISQHPEVEARIHEEVDTVLNGRLPGVHDIEQLTYTRMVFAESMRLYPPVWMIPRKALDDFRIGGFTIPRGSTVGMSQYVIHHDRRYFPDPFRFDPLRWTDEAVEQRPKFSYFPFGGGPRLCMGDQFAWIEGVIVLAVLSQTWRLHLLAPEAVKVEPLLTLRPKNGIRMVVKRRNSGCGETVVQRTLAAG